MARHCQSAPSAQQGRGGREQPLIAFVGNPNVGKSTLFNHLTGERVTTAHYAGTTVDAAVADTEVDGRPARIMDLPGAYALTGAPTGDPGVAETLLESAPDAVVVVVDATNLARNLPLALEALDLGLPAVVALNLADEARASGIAIDTGAVAALVGTRVVETVAVTGEGVLELMRAALDMAAEGAVAGGPIHRYEVGFERLVAPLVTVTERRCTVVGRLGGRGLALKLLEADPEVTAGLSSAGESGLLRVAEEVRVSLRHAAHEGVPRTVAEARHRLAARIADDATERAEQRARVAWERLATSPKSGIPLLAGVLASIFLFLFFVGEFLAGVFSGAWARFASPNITAAVEALAGEGVAARTLLWGLDSGIEAALGIGLPYILTFYFLLALVEDSGYLNAVAFLADRSMHRFGLHGRAVIPLVAGAGCSVPAILATRMLSTGRERFIAATLVSFVPCSARTAVILGAVGHYVGIGPALGVYVVTLLVIGLVGIGMSRLVPGHAGGLVMEMFPFRRPDARVVARKAWSQFTEFLVVALPVVIVGSIVLGGLYESGWLWTLTTPLDPVVSGLLGLPSVAGLTLLFGLLRKEFALQLLATLAIATMGEGAGDLASFMSGTDLFVYALVNTLAFPCISAVAVLGRVVGVVRAAGVISVTVGAALLVGTLFAKGIPVFMQLVGGGGL